MQDEQQKSKSTLLSIQGLTASNQEQAAVWYCTEQTEGERPDTKPPFYLNLRDA
jgi:hypothetical protein